ncbi:hypothetical protein CO613_04075 [Lysobacteraceae bacterium NML07-0707]|nr:hypothetical protein CO613_04075 [Xanthomonadaceae bacterium NML07-0707]
MLPLVAVLLVSACVSVDSVHIPQAEPQAVEGDFRRFHCDNGYRVSVKYRSPEQISVSFNNGNDTFVVVANSTPAASGADYVNNLGNLRWHEKGDIAHFTYPASDWRSSRHLLETTCRAH